MKKKICENCKKENKGKYKHLCVLCYNRSIPRQAVVIASLPKEEQVKLRAKRAMFARNWRKNYPEKSRKANREKLGTGLSDTVIFYGYKEPLVKFENGFGYRGVLSYSKDADKVQCHFCGLLFRSINNGHLDKCHKLTALTYKEKTGLSPTTALVGEGTRKKLIDRGWNPKHMEELKKAQQNRRDRKAKGLPDLQSGKKMSLEIKNKRGTCPDQLLDKIDKTIKSFGRVPTEEEFLTFHQGKFLGSIRNTYGTWTNALAKLGHRPNNLGFTREELLEAMRNFYKVHKRTPRWSDMERGLLPSGNVYYKNFVSLNMAREEAGVPVLIPLGNRKYDEVLLKQK
jgi:hypothetical protein